MKKVNNIRNYIINESIFKKWEDVFANHGQIKIETLKTGIIIGKISGIINLKNAEAAKIKDGPVKLPVLAHIIRHEKYGNYLIDTGFDSSFRDEAGGNFKGILKKAYFTNRYIQEKADQGIEKQIYKQDIKLKGVFLTHIHEHASGAPSLPNEIPYIYGDGERDQNFFPFIYSDFFRDKLDLQKIDFSLAQDMPIIGKCVDIFGDGSFWAISTPGHTKGHISYLVNTKESPILITGDTCISEKGFKIGVESGKYSLSLEEGRQSFLKLIEFTKKYPFIKLIFGHETDEFKIEYNID